MNNTPTNSFLIQAVEGKKLRKVQIHFNERYRDMASLQKKLLQTGTELDEQLAFYQKEVAPVILSLYDTRKSLVKALFNFYERGSKEIPGDDLEFLGALIESQLGQILERENKPDAELKGMFKAFKGTDYEKSLDDNVEDTKLRLVSSLRDFGFVVADDIFEQARTLDELDEAFKQVLVENEEAAAEITDESDPLVQFFAKSKSNEAEKDKSNAQLNLDRVEKEKETAVEALKLEYIETIYPQLAELFAPKNQDDAQRKVEKDFLMKTLSNAYKLKHAFSILNLELRWMHQGANNMADLSDEKLHIYGEILKEHTTQLKSQLLLVQKDPRYNDMQAVCDYGHVTEKKLRDYCLRCHKLMDSMNELLTMLLKDDRSAVAAAKSIMDFNGARDLTVDQLEPFLMVIGDQQGEMVELETLFKRNL